MTDDTERSPGAWSIRIECDEPGRAHPKKRPVVTVTTFFHIGFDREGDPNNGRWTEENRSPYLQRTLGASGGLPDSGTTLVDNKVPTDPAGLMPSDEVLAATRSVYALACSKCRQPPDQYRQETLFAALNKARHAGRTHLSLAEVAGIVHDMARYSA